jgi:hypothetical protein
VLDYHIEPEVGLDLFHNVSELGGGDAFDWLVVLAKWHKEIYDAFRDSNLLAFLVDVLVLGEVKKNLGVSKVFVLGFGHFRLQRRIDQEH